MYKGKVKWFNDSKGYGFIISNDGCELFVHFKSINMDGFKTLKEGQTVSYNIMKSQKGLQAIEVMVV